MGFRRGLKIFVGHVGVGVVAPAGPHLLAKKPIRATFPRNHVAVANSALNVTATTAAATEATRKAAILAADSGVFANNSSTDLLDEALAKHEPRTDVTIAQIAPFDPEFPSEISEGLIEAVKSTYTSFENVVQASATSFLELPIVDNANVDSQSKPKSRALAKRSKVTVPTLSSILEEEELEEHGGSLSCPLELPIVDDANVDAQAKPESLTVADCTATAAVALAPLSLAELMEEVADFIEPSSLKRLIKICADGEWVPNKYTAAKLVMFELRLESIPEVDEPAPEAVKQASRDFDNAIVDAVEVGVVQLGSEMQQSSSAAESIATVPVHSVHETKSCPGEVAQIPCDLERRAAETKTDKQEEEQHTLSRGEGSLIAPAPLAAPASMPKTETKSSEIHLTSSTTDTTANADATFADVCGASAPTCQAADAEAVGSALADAAFAQGREASVLARGAAADAVSATSAVVAEVKEMNVVESCELAVPDGGSCDTTTAIIAAVPQQCVVGRHLAAEPLAVDGIATSPLHRRFPTGADASLLRDSSKDKDGDSVQEQQQQSVQVQEHLDYQSASLKVDARVEPAQLESSSSAATSSKVAEVGSVASSPQERREYGPNKGFRGQMPPAEYDSTVHGHGLFLPVGQESLIRSMPREHGKPMRVKKPQWVRKLGARIAAVRAWFANSP
ncbi:hypothetical protein H9P43_006177 [Blastocladiella emersonii ATCC 22665]|nr:hypothetical protein H9P43_006177 [Blastocladiella emersonii ATCC 22665]